MIQHDTLLSIAETWSHWTQPIAPSVPRNVRLPAVLSDRIVLVIQGVRRCGKSTLMRQLVSRYELNPQHCVFLNFEDPRLSNSLHFDTLQALVDAFRNARPDAATRYFFLDEIQGVDGWERWLRAQLDRPRGDVFVISGSNAALLSGELGSTLTGRHLSVELYPFDFNEFSIALPGASVAEFLHTGGFPEPLSRPDGDLLLRQYFHDIVERDIRERLGARSSRTLRQVLQMAFESAGSELSLRRIAAPAGIAVETAAAYLEAAEMAYLLHSVPFFAFSERKRGSFPRKYYPVDPGLRRVVSTPGGADLGKALECATCVALRRRYRDVSYWRGKGEVDFVVQEAGRIIPIQVTVDAAQPRHEKALDDFYEAFPQAGEALFVTLANLGELFEEVATSRF
jgi:predicted AAA+ superfamily ATPase